MSTEESTPAELVSEVLNGSYQWRIPGTGDMRHGSEGWHALETSCKVMLCLCKGVLVQRNAVNFNRDTSGGKVQLVVANCKEPKKAWHLAAAAHFC